MKLTDLKIRKLRPAERPIQPGLAEPVLAVVRPVEVQALDAGVAAAHRVVAVRAEAQHPVALDGGQQAAAGLAQGAGGGQLGGHTPG